MTRARFQMANRWRATRVAAMWLVVLGGSLPAWGAASADAAVADDRAKLLSAYGVVQETLAADSMDGVTASARAIAAIAEGAGGLGAKAKDAAPFQAVAERAAALAKTGEIETARESFKGLSLAMAKLVETGEITGADLYYCPMANGYWLQKEGQAELRNPYYGKEMLTCGEKVEKVAG